MEQERSGRLCDQKHRVSFITTRGILRIILSQYLSTTPDTIDFEYNHFGKPRMANASDVIHFNIAHSGSIALYIFSKISEVGIDVERVRPLADLYGLAQRYFSAGEIEDLNAVSQQDRITSFYRCWTRKEAFVKAAGTGLSYALDQFQVSLATISEQSMLTSVNNNLIAASQWSLYSLTTYVGYEAAYCFKGHGNSIKVLNYA